MGGNLVTHAGGQPGELQHHPPCSLSLSLSLRWGGRCSFPYFCGVATFHLRILVYYFHLRIPVYYGHFGKLVYPTAVLPCSKAGNSGVLASLHLTLEEGTAQLSVCISCAVNLKSLQVLKSLLNLKSLKEELRLVGWAGDDEP